MRIKHYANIDDKGKLILSNPDEFKKQLVELAPPKGESPKRVFVVVDENRPIRSTEQLRYWFGVMLKLISKHIELTTGQKFSGEELHEYYIEKGYFGYSTKVVLDKEIVLRNRSGKVNTKIFKEVIERLQREWAERGLIIPDPNQVDFKDED